MSVNNTFSIEPTEYSEQFKHSKFVAYKVKDAMVDWFREKTGDRPSVRLDNPDLNLNIHIAGNR